jgi:predicted TIM-barrel fold metal-dependent hydrolase
MVGAHIGSLEWSLEEVAKRFDAHPNFTVDLAARMPNLYYHAFIDRSKLQSFITKYQDRILYGSDMGCWDIDTSKIEDRKKAVHNSWLQQWGFFATDDIIPTNYFIIEPAPKEVAGLRLPRKMVDKLFYHNAKRVFNFS